MGGPGPLNAVGPQAGTRSGAKAAQVDSGARGAWQCGASFSRGDFEVGDNVSRVVGGLMSRSSSGC